MRKMLFVVLFFISNMPFACEGDDYFPSELFNIIIFNATTSDCSLTSQSIKNGMIYSKTLPLRISPEEQSEPYTLGYNCANGQTEITMSLQCGNDKFITIQSQRKIKFGFLGFSKYEENILGLVTAAANLDAEYAGKIHESYTSKIATIYWVLK